MRIIFFGSPPEAVGALESLLMAGHEMIAVYSQPDSRAGRGRQMTRTAVKEFADSPGLAISTPGTLRGNEIQLQMMQAAQADLFVVVAYGQILPVEVLEIPKMGVVNIHPALLPRHRGPSSPGASAPRTDPARARARARSARPAQRSSGAYAA